MSCKMYAWSLLVCMLGSPRLGLWCLWYGLIKCARTTMQEMHARSNLSARYSSYCHCCVGIVTHHPKYLFLFLSRYSCKCMPCLKQR